MSKNSRFLILIALIFAIFGVGNKTIATVTSSAISLNEQKLTPSDGKSHDFFGNSVAISGDYMIVGADNVDHGTHWGSIYFFERNDDNWQQVSKLTPNDLGTDRNDSFGITVSISGSYAIASSNDDATDINSVYLYMRSSGNWTQIDKLISSEIISKYAISISGDHIILGAPMDNAKGIESGSALIFKRNGTTWSQFKKLTASDGAEYSSFGASVSISGDLAIVGANGDDYYKGAVYIFKFNGSDWNELDKITASDSGGGYYGFGSAVSISSDYAIVGNMRNNNDMGSAYILKNNGSKWTEVAKLTASDGKTGAQFGNSVSIFGDSVIIGAYGDYDNQNVYTYKGAAYIFQRNGLKWTEMMKLTASDGAIEDAFGHCVSISEGIAIVGAPGKDGTYMDEGAVYLFTGFERKKTPNIIPIISCLLLDNDSGGHSGAILKVPSEYSTIQSAIDASTGGDTVLVANGTYTGTGNKNIDFKGKAITIKSENGPNDCIVDCQGVGLGFYFHTGEEQNSMLSGFTITNCQSGLGGAIAIDSSSPTIENCILKNNNVTSGYGSGGAISIWWGSSPIIKNCAFIENSADSSGGAIYHQDSSSRITDCLFKNNSSGTNGGAVSIYGSNVIMDSCIFEENSTGTYGGGLLVTISSSLIITNSVFTSNSGNYGGGIIIGSNSNSTITNCTFSGNTANFGGALSSGVNTNDSLSVALVNSILWNNSASDSGNEIYNDRNSILTISYSDIKGGISGITGTGNTTDEGGNINSDPEFVGSGDFRLKAVSPCVDSGTPDGVPNIDIEGISRPQGSGYDMGAYEYH